MTKCPHCSKPVSNVNIKAITAKSGARAFNAVAYECPLCLSAISIEIDPIALRTDIVNMVTDAVRKELRR